jgi:molybdenum cofactor biosynthesis enzyme MoaA
MTTARSIHRGKAKPVDERVFKMACQMAQQSGLDTARITGKGEPTLFPDQIEQFLRALQPYGFTFVEMQTHGRHLADEDFVSLEDMHKWADLGLTHVCISVVSYKSERNFQHYFAHSQSYDSYFDMAALISKLHRLRINVRLTCIMQKGDIDSAEELVKFMSWAKEVKADQVTILPVNKPEDRERNPRVYDAAMNSLLAAEQLADIRGYVEKHGVPIRTLPWGAKVFDLKGQNLCFNMCLTESPERDDSRQLIFYPPGTLGHDWQRQGAVLYELPAEATEGMELIPVRKRQGGKK